MKKYLFKIMVGILFFSTISCNGYYRFIISPVPGAAIIVRPPSPGAGHIWIDGEWFWNGRTYVQRDGYWTLPLNGSVWVPGRWKKRSNGWYWNPGHWRR